MMASIAYKLVARDDWEAAIASGPFEGSAVDEADGYIHLSGADTVAETARRHYSGQDHLLLLTVDLTRLGDVVVWERSRGGALFPHVYGTLPASAVTEIRPLAVDGSGTMIFEDGAGL